MCLDELKKMNPLAGFSAITFYAYGREIPVLGFLQREVREMKWLVEGMLKRQHICLAVLNKSVNFFRKRQVTE